MPERSLYDEAILLSQARLEVTDPELKEGLVETITVHTAAGPTYRPWGSQGGFAVVYKFQTRSGKMRALRCFLAQMKPDMQFRYERIGTYFAAHVPQITIEFKYHASGIVLKEPVRGQIEAKTYPLIEMEWIEGTTLIERVDELCSQRDQAGLKNLVHQWEAILSTLHAAHIAHGDLAGANIMVKPDGRLVLVDYDGVYIPNFAGLHPVVAGQSDYQHPQMQQRPFNEHMDGFSALVIYTALLALQVQPELWEKYIHRNARGRVLDTNLLFKQHDFLDPDRSSLMSELAAMSDPRVRRAVQKLKQACQQSVAQVEFPFDIIDPDFDKKQAVIKLEQAIQRNDDEEIINAWMPLLDNYSPALVYVARVESARQTMQILKLFRQALSTHIIQQIVAAYNPALDYCKSVKQQERDILRLAKSFVEAYDKDDDAALAALCEEIRLLNYGSFFTFTLEEAQRSVLAQHRIAALTTFRQALGSKKIQQIANAYDPVLDGVQLVTAQERDVLREAQSFVQAYQSDDDKAILAARDSIQRPQYAMSFIFTSQEQQRLAFAQQRTAALMRFRSALTSKSIQQVVAAYDPILDNSKSITYEERTLLQVAQSFVQAYQSDDDQAILSASEVIELAAYRQSLMFNAQEEQRILLAQQRKDALMKFRQALASQEFEQIVAAYDPVLTNCKNVIQEEREQLALASNLLQAYKQDNDRAITSVWNDIQTSRYRGAFSLTVEQQRRIDLAKVRITAVERFRKTLAANSNDALQIVSSYDPVLDGYKEVTAQERMQLEAAHRCVDMHEAVLAGIRADDDVQIASAYDEELTQQFSVFTPQEQQRINRGLKRGRLEKALQGKDYRCAIWLAQEFEMESHKPFTDIRLTIAKQKFIKQFDVKDLEVWLQGDEVIARWRWPPDELVRYAVILWRFDRWPHHPRREEQGTGRTWVFRNGNEQGSITRFKAVQYMPIYLQVYLAIPDESRYPGSWFYSNGDEAGSKKAVNQ